MTLLPEPWWPVAVMALIVLVDGALTFKPPKFIADCLDGVGLPRDWWWVLAAVKFPAAIGLFAGIWIPGIGLAAIFGLIAYFLTAAIAHVRAGYVGRDFWLNCLGMLAVCLAVLVFCFLV